MKTLYILDNSIQPYAWGSIDGISAFTGMQNETGTPMAELWMGAHPASSSRITAENRDGEPISLDSFIGQNPEAILGKQTARKFGNRLPFLFKVLSAGSPLSLQVHPTKQQAEAGFARDNAAGIPLGSPDRNYRDDNHKPEIIMAITPFIAMCGFRTVAETTSLFALSGIPALEPILATLQISETYTSFCKQLLDLSNIESAAVISAILKKARQIIAVSTDQIAVRAFTLVLDLAAYYPVDIGILAPLYLNVIDLAPGEALYLRAGIMHAYVRGTGLELMASSDNVLRGGLTPKHIDIPELLSILDPAPHTTAVIPPGKEAGVYRYRTESTEFELSRVTVDETEIIITSDYPAILIGADGKIGIKTETDEKAELAKGSTLFVAATGEKLVFSGKGTCYMASMPSRLQEST